MRNEYITDEWRIFRFTRDGQARVNGELLPVPAGTLVVGNVRESNNGRKTAQAPYYAGVHSWVELGITKIELASNLRLEDILQDLKLMNIDISLIDTHEYEPVKEPVRIEDSAVILPAWLYGPVVYTYRDYAGKPLRHGSARDGLRRLADHPKNKPYVSQASNILVVPCRTYTEALIKELALLQSSPGSCNNPGYEIPHIIEELQKSSD